MNNSNNNLGFLDVINIISFLAQMTNMEEDDKDKEWIHQVIQVISDEIQKLHNENDIIMSQQNIIINKLDELKEIRA